MPDDRCESRMSAPVIRRLTGGDTEYAALIADRMYDWWGKAEGYSREAVRAHIERGFNEDRLPMTFGMFLNGRLIGMYQFTYSDLFPAPTFIPGLRTSVSTRASAGAAWEGSSSRPSAGTLLNTLSMTSSSSSPRIRGFTKNTAGSASGRSIPSSSPGCRGFTG